MPLSAHFLLLYICIYAHTYVSVCIPKEEIQVLFELKRENAVEDLRLKQFSLTPAMNSFIVAIRAVVDPIAQLGQMDAFVGTNAADKIRAALEI